tara:strand:- start:23 stop:562 length:540 start_codon:yes stop_codon:yes gene_type:complete
MIYWKKIHTLAFDFDGVFTDNKVWVNQEGIESIRCDRSDSLGLNLLQKFIDINKWDLDYFIITTETNPAVLRRAEKLNIKCFHSIENKLKFIQDRLSKRFTNLNECRDGLVYLGNDLNDLSIMNFSGFSVAPSDADKRILAKANQVLSKKGGDGFVREFIDILLDISNKEDDEIANLLL